MRSFPRRLSLACVIGFVGLAAGLAAQELAVQTKTGRWKQHDMRRPKPPVVEPAEAPIAAKPPKDAVVLFDGSNLDAWYAPEGGPLRWKIGDGYMETAPGAGPIETKEKYGDIQLHIEFATPSPPHGKGQDRGNSGVFLMGQFEIQVLDSYKADTYADGQAGAIYGQYPPIFNASRPPGEWQTYDVAFRRPRFDAAGKLLERARITLFHNGILVQNNEEPFGPTAWIRSLPYSDPANVGPISLQDHDHPVRYRNIWLRPLPERPAPTPDILAAPKIVNLPADVLSSYTGRYIVSTKPNAPTATITQVDNHLVIVYPTRPQPLTLEPISETQFDMPFADGHFTFQKDDRGRVTGVLFKIADSERVYTKVQP